MFVFDRPIGVDVELDDAGLSAALHVLARGNEGDIGSVYPFPMSLLELVHWCASIVKDLGPYTRNNASRSEAQDVLAMTDDELIGALQQALGKVRIFNMMGVDD